MIGLLGGMGPAATVDFLGKLVALTPASRDQDHLPVVVANLPQIPDRSAAILGRGPSPLPQLLAGIDLLNQAGTGLNVVACNTAHHWFEAMASHSRAPMLHIAQASVAALQPGSPGPVSIFATRGTLQSGLYQRALAAAGITHSTPDAVALQPHVDACIQAVKAGDLASAGQQLALALAACQAGGVQAVILACTELPVAAQQLPPQPLLLIDSSMELARRAVRHALDRGWNIPRPVLGAQRHGAAGGATALPGGQPRPPAPLS